MTELELRQLSWRLERARELLADAGAEKYAGRTPDAPGYYPSLCGALEAQLDLVCESAEAVLAGLAP